MDPRLLDLLCWFMVKDSVWPNEFEAYLKAFPDGVFKKSAEYRINALLGRPQPKDTL